MGSKLMQGSGQDYVILRSSPIYTIPYSKLNGKLPLQIDRTMQIASIIWAILNIITIKQHPLGFNFALKIESLAAPERR